MVYAKRADVTLDKNYAYSRKIKVLKLICLATYCSGQDNVAK